MLFACGSAKAQIPFVYNQENTGKHFEPPVMPDPDKLPIIRELPDALEGVKDFGDWERRRNVIGAQIQHYGIGVKPEVKPERLKATLSENVLTVEVTGKY